MTPKRLIVASLALAIVLATPAQAFAPVHKLAPKKLISLAMSHPKAYALQLLKAKGIANQFGCLVKLVNRESHWNPKAHNSTPVWQNGKWLHAYGIGQLITETSHDPATQIRNMLRYINYRYQNSPCLALRHHYRWNWY